MRQTASVLHLDLDAFFAAVEQRDKPSLRGKPVVVGGLGARGVVATASYEARAFGVHSAMSMSEARRRCPHAAFLWGRFDAYRAASRLVMGVLHELSPLVEQLSIDEAYVDLAAGGHDVADPEALVGLAERVRAEVGARTGGLTASVGLGSSKFMAKLGSELAKPNGVRLIEPGTEVALIAPLTVRAVPGIGPVTMEKLNRLGVRTVGDLQALSVRELIRELGRSWGEGLHELAFARDDRPVEPGRETKSISVEQTFEIDVRDRAALEAILVTDAERVAERVRAARLFARTISIKARLADFTTLSRSRTLTGATDRGEVFADVGRELLAGIPMGTGLRLLGIGVANFTEAAQEELFTWRDGADVAIDSSGREAEPIGSPEAGGETTTSVWRPGMDVVHSSRGPGWVWGSGLGRVTVRFETAATGVGPVHTFSVDDPELTRALPPVGEDGEDGRQGRP